MSRYGNHSGCFCTGAAAPLRVLIKGLTLGLHAIYNIRYSSALNSSAFDR